MKRVYKYGTGDEIPEDAVYLHTLKQEQEVISRTTVPCWLVWHYFLVEVD